MGSVQGYEQDNCTVQCLNQDVQGYIEEHRDPLHPSCLFFLLDHDGQTRVPEKSQFSEDHDCTAYPGLLGLMT